MKISSVTQTVRHAILIVAPFLLAGLYPNQFAGADDLNITWEHLSPGLEEARFQLPGNSILTPSFVVIRASPQHFRVQVIRAAEYGSRRSTVRSLCKSSGASVCINSNFFDEQGKPLGLVISRGILHQKIHNGGGTLTGILYVTADHVGVAQRSGFSSQGVLEATQAGPRLISEGAPVVGLKNSSSTSNLSLICIDKESRILLVRVALAMFGGSLQEIQQTLLRPEIGCHEALNFDGGGSSQLFISGDIPGHAGAVREEDFPGRDEVPVALGLFSIK
jgi:exopolysaccharide biosynthesis protein